MSAVGGALPSRREGVEQEIGETDRRPETEPPARSRRRAQNERTGGSPPSLGPSTSTTAVAGGWLRPLRSSFLFPLMLMGDAPELDAWHGTMIVAQACACACACLLSLSLFLSSPDPARLPLFSSLSSRLSLDSQLSAQLSSLSLLCSLQQVTNLPRPYAPKPSHLPHPLYPRCPSQMNKPDRSP